MDNPALELEDELIRQDCRAVHPACRSPANDEASLPPRESLRENVSILNDEQDSVQEFEQKSVQNCIQESVQEPLQTSVQNTVHNSVQGSVQNSVQEYDRNKVALPFEKGWCEEKMQNADSPRSRARFVLPQSAALSKYKWLADSFPVNQQPVCKPSRPVSGRARQAHPRLNLSRPILPRRALPRQAASPPIKEQEFHPAERDSCNSCDETQVGVFCISKSGFEDDDTEFQKSIRPFSRCSQMYNSDAFEPESFSCYDPAKLDCVEVEIENQLELERNRSSKLVSPPSSIRDVNSNRSGRTRNHCDSPEKVLKVSNGLGDYAVRSGFGGIPTVAMAVPIMFAGLHVDPHILAPTAENRRNQRNQNHQESKLPGKLPGGCNLPSKLPGITRHGFNSRKLSFVDDQKSACSKRSMAALLCLLVLLTGAALVAWLSTSIGSFLEETRSEELSLIPEPNVVRGSFRVTKWPLQTSEGESESVRQKRMGAAITSELDAAFRSSLSLREIFNASRVSRVEPDGADPGAKLMVHCLVVLLAPPPLGESANLIGIEFLRALRRRGSHMWLGQFALDMSSIAFYGEKSVRPDKGATLSLLASWSPWTEWSGCGEGIETRSRSRFCRLGNGTGHILADIEPCLLLSNSDSPGGDLEVANCSTTDLLSVTFSMEDTTRLNQSDTHVSMEVRARSTKPRHCDDCTPSEVCVALARQDVPECREPVDPHDPTGCAGHCRLGVEICRKLDRDAYRCIEQQQCFETEFQCANLLCIPISKRCDGHNNCYDDSDEYNCDCDLQTHFHCLNRTSCVPREKRCDGVIDCWDGSDEANCTKACPGKEQLTCSNGQCVPRAYFCDSLPDCADGSDEPFGCGVRCHRHEWKCANGRCVSRARLCDQRDDCGDGSDERCDKNSTEKILTER